MFIFTQKLELFAIREWVVGRVGVVGEKLSNNINLEIFCSIGISVILQVSISNRCILILNNQSGIISFI